MRTQVGIDGRILPLAKGSTRNEVEGEGCVINLPISDRNDKLPHPSSPREILGATPLG